jgi:hypothetical protein
MAKTSKPAKVGRPPKPPGEKFVMAGLRLPPAELAKIDAMVQPGQTRNDVLRELVAAGMAAKKGKR